MSELTVEQLIEQGDSHRLNNEYSEAIECYSKAIAQDPNRYEAFLGRGIVYSRKKEYMKALADYNSAIALNPLSKNSYRNRGLTYKRLGKTEEALIDFSRAIEMDNKFADAYNDRGTTYVDLKSYEQALINYNVAIELDPINKQFYRNRGMVYKELDRYEEAIADYTKAIEIDNKFTGAYNSRGIVYRKQGKYDEAIADYTKAIEIDPKFSLVYRNRGSVYLDKKMLEEALKDFTSAIDIDNGYANAYNSRGLAYYELGKYREAFDDFSMAIELDPDHQTAYKNRERANRELDNNMLDKDDIIKTKLNEVKARDENFYHYLSKADMSEDKKAQISELFLEVMKLKDMLLYKDIKSVGHYTKLGNLKHIIKPLSHMKDGINPRMRLNNVSYMNDPTEGEVFLKLLTQDDAEDVEKIIEHLYSNQSNNHREVLSGKNHVFLLSFSTAIDTSLPMWVQYSENGEGCCLVYSKDFFDSEDKTCLAYPFKETAETISEEESETDEDSRSKSIKKQYYCLYKIKYIASEDNQYKLKDDKIKDLIKRVGSLLVGFKTDLEHDTDSKLKGIIQNILDQVRFLFKDENYDHEEEVRLVKFEDNGNVKYTGDAEGFRVPHVYINLERDIHIEEVIFGPKVQNAIEIANYLYYTERVDEVSKSIIKYK